MSPVLGSLLAVQWPLHPSVLAHSMYLGHNWAEAFVTYSILLDFGWA